MTRIGILFGLSLVLVGCKDRAPEPLPPPPKGFSDEGAAAGARIGQYLQAAVVSEKLRACWAGLAAETAVATDLTYRKAGDTWLFTTARVMRSTLPKDQEATVERCIEESANGTTFTVDSTQELERSVQEFVVRLGWTSPLPPPGTEMSPEQMARMIGTGGVGGVITIPGCSDCELRGEEPYGYKCVPKKSGSQQDCEEVETNVCATTRKACLRGVFGGLRGVIMY